MHPEPGAQRSQEIQFGATGAIRLGVEVLELQRVRLGKFRLKLTPKCRFKIVLLPSTTFNLHLDVPSGWLANCLKVSEKFPSLTRSEGFVHLL